MVSSPHNKPSNSLPEAGSVLGVDIGYSQLRRSSAVCRLDWTLSTISFSIERFSASEPERSNILSIVADRSLLAAAFDGPLRSDLRIIGRYRLAEQLLTRRLRPFIGKPGQASAPVGKLLNAHANACAKIVIDLDRVGAAAHDHAIHALAIVEAFPTTFLGLLIEEPASLQVRRSNRSDNFYVHLAKTEGLSQLVRWLLPDRQLTRSLNTITNHDERASLVCALTALCVAAGDYSAVGDADGWIILPPASLIQKWAWKILSENAVDGGLDCRPLSSNRIDTIAMHGIDI
jgi:hypothetical protein